jgi:hypothetical protein
MRCFAKCIKCGAAQEVFPGKYNAFFCDSCGAANELADKRYVYDETTQSFILEEILKE